MMAHLLLNLLKRDTFQTRRRIEQFRLQERTKDLETYFYLQGWLFRDFAALFQDIENDRDSLLFSLPFKFFFFNIITVIIFNRTDNQDRKSTRLNSSHVSISYAVFCLKKKTK